MCIGTQFPILPLPPVEWYEAAIGDHGLTEIPLDGRTAIAATALPPLHRDPADRILVATALAHGLTILTPDSRVRAYPGVASLW